MRLSAEKPTTSAMIPTLATIVDTLTPRIESPQQSITMNAMYLSRLDRIDRTDLAL